MKKKSLLVAGLACVCLLIACIFLFVPIKREEKVTMPAMIFSDTKSEIEQTNLTVEGTWIRSIATPSRQSFEGKIQVDSLDYTHKENGWDLNFQVTNDASEDYLSGGLFYNSDSDFTGYGWLYTNNNHTYYVLVTNLFNEQNDDYIVIAPAETEEEAKNICNVMGLKFLQD